MTGDGRTVELRDLPLAGALVDGAGHVVEAAPPFADLVGRDREALAGQSILDLVAPDDRGRVAASWATGGGAELAVAGRRDDGLPFAATWSVPKGDVEADRLLVAARRGPPIRGTWSPADESDDGDGRDVVDSALSHDVRGALRGVAGFLSILGRDRAAWSDEAQGYLETARRSAANADAMAERLVEYVRLAQRPLVVGRVELADVLAEAGDEQVEAAATAPTVRVDRLPAVVGQRSTLVALFAELLANAAKFGASAVSVTARVEGDWVYVKVDDDGPGIDEALRGRAFDLFRLLQAKGRHPGIGAGLAIVRRIADVHGGACWIESGDEGGTAVVTRLLLATDAPR